ncbi:hypothetical protein GP486_001925 [Trichoglossum hirsutum]|uniref:Uncharacterized protein n=1 Tax=Trichoglossum hirsutum TaxID=265104 RepID=A0A9P8LG30_9PEZI|nr:hypothetical protein GP486_001925 [Trichoglossum hirsutum]
MADWISVPGNVIVSDADSPVVIANHADGAMVKPSGGNLKGVFHVSVPSAPNGSAKLKKLEVRHTHILSKTVGIKIVYGNSLMYDSQASPLNIASIDNLGIDGEPDRFAWDVAIEVEFSGQNSILLVSCVTLTFQ